MGDNIWSTIFAEPGLIRAETSISFAASYGPRVNPGLDYEEVLSISSLNYPVKRKHKTTARANEEINVRINV